jgi:hypothetical protein
MPDLIVRIVAWARSNMSRMGYMCSTEEATLADVDGVLNQ